MGICFFSTIILIGFEEKASNIKDFALQKGSLVQRELSRKQRD